MNKKIILIGLMCLGAFFAFKKEEKPVLYIIGDSTVRNANKETWGWGTPIADLFDTTKIHVENQAMAGRSTRTFLSEGRWEKVLQDLKPGDFVTMQFGHNDGSVPDTTKAGRRGVLKGTGEETKVLTWPDGKIETVHTYGWYLRKFVREAKAKGAVPIIISMIPRNQFKNGKVLRAADSFGKWAADVAKKEAVYFIDLNRIVADKYDVMGPEKVKAFFPEDHTHTNLEGARLNAASVVEGIKALIGCALKNYLMAPKPTLFLIGDSTVKNGKGKGDGLLWGWGSFLNEFFDLDKITIENHALGGTSTRTFRSKGLWDSVLLKLKPGDFVLMQFGHNDGSPLDDTARARGTIKGTGIESKAIFNPITKKKEMVYTYGAYLRKFISEAKSKGAMPVLCSPVPRNPVKNGVLTLEVDSYAGWAEEIATSEKVGFVSLNKIVKNKYAAWGAEKVDGFFTKTDHTHTNEAGAKVNAAAVVQGLRDLKGAPFVKYLKP